MRGNRNSILIADDDPGFCAALSRLLQDAGFEVRSALTAAEGAELALGQAFDLLLADIHMPGNERLEWLQEIAERHPELPVIVITGNPSVETAIGAVRLSIRSYLVKPVASDQLLAEITRVLDQAARPLRCLERTLARARVSWGLTARQADVLRELAGGSCNKVIAVRLQCTLRTVEDHLGALFQKAGVDSRCELVARFWAGEARTSPRSPEPSRHRAPAAPPGVG